VVAQFPQENRKGDRIQGTGVREGTSCDCLVAGEKKLCGQELGIDGGVESLGSSVESQSDSASRAAAEDVSRRDAETQRKRGGDRAARLEMLLVAARHRLRQPVLPIAG
jgi:hypothetical protein